jgi:trans-aconitate methyltransferase
MSDAVRDAWDAGQPYEQYMGRWSTRVAESFVHWIGQAPGMAWADVGCGTGALTSAILADCQPASGAGLDSSAFISLARHRLRTRGFDSRWQMPRVCRGHRACSTSLCPAWC